MGLSFPPWEFPVPGGRARKELRGTIRDEVGLSRPPWELQVDQTVRSDQYNAICAAWPSRPMASRRRRAQGMQLNSLDRMEWFPAARRGRDYEGLFGTRWDYRFRLGNSRFPAAGRGRDYEGLFGTRWDYRSPPGNPVFYVVGVDCVFRNTFGPFFSYRLHPASPASPPPCVDRHYHHSFHT